MAYEPPKYAAKSLLEVFQICKSRDDSVPLASRLQREKVAKRASAMAARIKMQKDFSERTTIVARIQSTMKRVAQDHLIGGINTQASQSLALNSQIVAGPQLGRLGQPGAATEFKETPILVIAHESDVSASGGIRGGACQCRRCADIVALAVRHGWKIARRSDLLRRHQVSPDALAAFLQRTDVVIAVGPGADRPAVARALSLRTGAAEGDSGDCLCGMRLASFEDVERAIGHGSDALARLASTPWVPPPQPAPAPAGGSAGGSAADFAASAGPAAPRPARLGGRSWRTGPPGWVLISPSATGFHPSVTLPSPYPCSGPPDPA